MTFSRSFVAGLAITATAVMALGAQADPTRSAAGIVRFPKYSAAPIGVSETELLRRMSDANILGHLATVDSVEVTLSEWAALQSKSDAVIAYAKQMDVRYRSNLNRDHQLGQETGLGLTTMAGELAREHIGPSLDSVRNASDMNLDRHYLMSQLQLHGHMLGELQILQSVARQPAIRERITAQLPIVQDELDRARTIAASKGYVSSKMK